MPAPKKAAKKKAVHKPEDTKLGHKDKEKNRLKEPKHKTLKDLRRSYEHLGRVESLLSQLPAALKSQVNALIALAQRQMNDGDAKSAADLLRACEHLSFAGVYKAETRNTHLAPVIKQAVDEEFEHLAQKASKRWEETADRHTEVEGVFKSALDGAEQALAKGAYRRAMELVRAAEALAHVEQHAPGKLTAGKPRFSLKA